MTAKILLVLLVVVMILHLVKPIGLPGLRQRRDAWKLGFILVVAMMLAVLVRPE